MSARANKLTARQVELFNRAELPTGIGKRRLSDGGNLYLIKWEQSSSSYFYFGFQGRRREMRLGGYPVISLAEARKLANAARIKLINGINPLDERASQKFKVATFGELADEYLKMNANQWGEKTAWQWRVDLTEKAKSIRRIPITEITHHVVAPLLKPI